MRTIAQAKEDCRAAWAAQPEATQGWCIHHGQEWEALSEPIANRIAYILSNKPKSEQVSRLDNMRPLSAASLALVLPALKLYEETRAQAWKLYGETLVQAWKLYEETKAQALKLYEKTKAPAHRQDVPNHTWNGKSIFKS